MKKIHKVTLVLLIALLLMGSIFGCNTYTDSGNSTPTPSLSVEPSPTSEGDNGDDKGGTPVVKETTFTFVGDQPATLNMILSVSNIDSHIFYLTSAMLFRPYKGVSYPEVCESFTVSDDKTVYTYYLRDAVYSDGTPITASDFAYYLLASLDPEMGSARAADLINTYGFKNAAAYNAGECSREDVGIKALDDKTLEITLEKPIAIFDGKLDIYPLREEFVKEKGEALGGTPADLEYSGPYILNEWVFDGYMSFTKNPTYINADTSFPTTHLKMVISSDHNTRVTMFENGEVDCLMMVGNDYLDILKDYTVHFTGGGHQAIQFNRLNSDPEKAAILGNKNFRKALSYALNREALVAATNPSAGPLTRIVNANHGGAREDSLFVEDFKLDTVPVNGDVDKAKEYLQAALEELGYSSVSELPELSYLTFEVPTYRLIAETVVDQWKQLLGLNNISITLLPVPQAIQAMMTYDYDIYYTSLSTGSDPSDILRMWITGGAVNDITGSGWNLFTNEEYDSLVAEAVVTFDRAKRMELLARAEQILLEEGPLEPLIVDGGYYAVAPYVEGFVYSSDYYEFNELVVNK
ncbi:MAG: peptide ABC transporter substrate-binding protein [Eubacteriales bacterium]